MLPDHKSVNKMILSLHCLSQVETNNSNRMPERNNLKCRTGGQNVARVLTEGLGRGPQDIRFVHWFHVRLRSRQAAPGYLWKTMPAQRLTVPIGTWICLWASGQTVGKRKGRPEALPVLRQGIGMVRRVGRGQCQGVCYPLRTSHGRLGACR